jgi:septum formation protein
MTDASRADPPRPSLLLASTSGARAALLTQARIRHERVASGVDETTLHAPTPSELVALLASAKARAVAARSLNALVLGCDSLLGIDGRALGKPATANAAREHWQLIAGRATTLFTGHCLLHVQGGHVIAHAEAVARTDVHMGRPTPAELERYIASGEPLASAGGFTLEGQSAPFIDGIAGSPSNVIGLCLPTLAQLMRRVGFSVSDFWDTGS